MPTTRRKKKRQKSSVRRNSSSPLKCLICLSRKAIRAGGKLCTPCSETFTWSVKYSGFHRKGAPRSIRFKGERSLWNILRQLFPGEKILSSFRPLWCKGTKGSPLEYDFYLPDRGILIELNGEQHYKASSWFDGRRFAGRSFAKRKANDIRKERLAGKNGFRLVVIKYRSPLTSTYILKCIEESR